MSATPRTDKVWEDGSNILAHARQLERELSAITLDKNLGDARLEGYKRIYAERESEMNARLMERQQTLIEKGVALEEMRKELAKSHAQITQIQDVLERIDAQGRPHSGGDTGCECELCENYDAVTRALELLTPKKEEA